MAVSCFSADADVIFGNITGAAGGGALACQGSGVGNLCPAGINGDILAAAAFTPTADFTMTDAQMFLDAGPFQANPAGGNLDVSLWSDLNGLPGSQIEDLGYVYVLSFTNFAPQVVPPAIYEIGADATLFAGTQYWLVLSIVTGPIGTAVVRRVYPSPPTSAHSTAPRGWTLAPTVCNSR
jgi:hypothetical protein